MQLFSDLSVPHSPKSDLQRSPFLRSVPWHRNRNFAVSGGQTSTGLTSGHGPVGRPVLGFVGERVFAGVGRGVFAPVGLGVSAGVGRGDPSSGAVRPVTR